MDNDTLERQIQTLEYTGNRVVVRDNEDALIGSVLKGGLPVFQRVKDIIKPEMFGNISYGEIWNVFEKLFENGLGIDTITVGDELERVYKLDSVSNGAVSGRALLADLRVLGDVRNIESYAENVQDYYVKKQLEEYGKKMIVWSANGRRSNDIMQDVNKLLGEIVLHSSKSNNHIQDLGAIVSLAYDETTEASNGVVKTVPTGLFDLDVLLNGGLRKGNLILEAARPAQGKTGLMVTVILNAIKSGKRVLMFSLEMTAVEVGHRLIAQEAQIPLDRIISGKLREDEWSLYTNAIDKFATMKDLLTVIDLGGIRIGNVRQLARREHAKKPLDLICFDYVQLAEPDKKNERRQLDVGEVSRGLKGLAKELDIPVFAAAQLSRALETRTDKRPVLSDLREAGDLENDSDVVIFIYRPDQYEKETDKHSIAELIVAKHRNGNVGSVETLFRGMFTQFVNVATAERRMK